MDVVIDTNVIITAMRSRYGASNRLLQELATGKTSVHISVPLFLEYAEVLLRFEDIGVKEYTDILSYIDTIAIHHNIFFLFRKFLSDNDDDMILELVIKANAQYIITYNIKDFKNAVQFGIVPITPKDYLQLIGVI